MSSTIEEPFDVDAEVADINHLLAEAADGRWDDSERWAPARATAAKFDLFADDEGVVDALILSHSEDFHIVTVWFGDGTIIPAFNMDDERFFLIGESVGVYRHGPTYFVKEESE